MDYIEIYDKIKNYCLHKFTVSYCNSAIRSFIEDLWNYRGEYYIGDLTLMIMNLKLEGFDNVSIDKLFDCFEGGLTEDYPVLSDADRFLLMSSIEVFKEVSLYVAPLDLIQIENIISGINYCAVNGLIFFDMIEEDGNITTHMFDERYSYPNRDKIQELLDTNLSTLKDVCRFHVELIKILKNTNHCKLIARFVMYKQLKNLGLEQILINCVDKYKYLKSLDSPEDFYNFVINDCTRFSS